MIVTAAVFSVLTGTLCFLFFYYREKRLLNRLMKMIADAEAGTLVLTDISEEKVSALENRMKRYLDDSLLENRNQKDQKEMIQRLISDISHQTLTPISNLKIYADLLKEELDEESGIVDTIREQADKLDFQIQSLVKLSRMESGIMKLHPKAEAVQDLFDSLYQAYVEKAACKNITLHFQKTRLSAVFDRKWTVEAVGNMVDNALKYTPWGGRVTVCAQAYSFFLRIDIADDGIGIGQEECTKIFARFYRSFDVADQPGVGIGLYLARELIQAQKGYVKVKSEKGKGSVFSVFLPSGCQ